MKNIDYDQYQGQAEFQSQPVIWLRALGLTHERAGDLMMAQNKPELAQEQYLHALSYSQRLSKSYPDNITLMWDEAYGYLKYSRTLDNTGNSIEALAQVEQAIELLARINDASPGRLDFLKPYELALQDAVKLAKRLGRNRLVLKYASKNMQTLKEMNALATDQQVLNEFADMAYMAADSATDMQAYSIAVNQLEAAVKLLQTQDENSVDSIFKLRLLAATHDRLYPVQVKMNDIAVAVNNAKMAFQYREKAYNLDPDNPKLKRELLSSLLTGAERLYMNGFNELATEVIGKIKILYPDYINRTSTDPEQILQSATLLSREAMINIKSKNDFKGALDLLANAIDKLLTIADQPEAKEKLAVWYGLAGDCELVAENFANALSFYKNGLTFSRLYSEISQADLVGMQQTTYLMNGKIGWIKARQGKTNEAMTWFSRASDQAADAATKFPNHRESIRALEHYKSAIQKIKNN